MTLAATNPHIARALVKAFFLVGNYRALCAGSHRVLGTSTLWSWVGSTQRHWYDGRGRNSRDFTSIYQPGAGAWAAGVSLTGFSILGSFRIYYYCTIGSSGTFLR